MAKSRVLGLAEVVPGPAELTSRRWKVQCDRGPELVVEAETRAEAFELYKKAAGIVATDHKPSIGPVEE